jgi:hypothetical protein
MKNFNKFSCRATPSVEISMTSAGAGKIAPAEMPMQRSGECGSRQLMRTPYEPSLRAG